MNEILYKLNYERYEVYIEYKYLSVTMYGYEGWEIWDYIQHPPGPCPDYYG